MGGEEDWLLEDEGLLEDDEKENGENGKVDAEVWWEKVKELEEVGRVFG